MVVCMYVGMFRVVLCLYCCWKMNRERFLYLASLILFNWSEDELIVSYSIIDFVRKFFRMEIIVIF